MYVLWVPIQCLSTIVLLDLDTVPTAWYFVFFSQIWILFRQLGIFCFSVRFGYCSNSLVYFVFLLDLDTVPTAWYFVLFFCQIWILFRELGIFCLFFCQIGILFRQLGIFCFSVRFGYCSDSLVFCFVLLLDLDTVPTAWYFLFFCQIWILFRQLGILCFSVRFG